MRNKPVNLLFLLLLTSCTASKTQNLVYKINIIESGELSTDLSSTIKNTYISYKNNLFEYEYKINSSISIDQQSGKSATRTSTDSTAISIIPKNGQFYYMFDFKGSLIKRDSLARKKSDFIRMDTGQLMQDPLNATFKKIREADLKDTAIGGTAYKMYTTSAIEPGQLGEIETKIFFLNSVDLVTPFNVLGRYPNLFNKYCMAGISYHILNKHVKLLTIISEIRPLTDIQDNLCNKITSSLKDR